MPLPRQQLMYSDPTSDYETAMAKLSGFTGIGEKPSVMNKPASDAYRAGDEDAFNTEVLANVVPILGALKRAAYAAYAASVPRGLPRLLKGHSLDSILAEPAVVRRVTSMSDDYFKQLGDLSKAQDNHAAILRAKAAAKGETADMPADILSVAMDDPKYGDHLYEVMSPGRGWVTLNNNGYIGGIMSEKPGSALFNPIVNAMIKEQGGPVRATAANQALVNYYRSKGVPVKSDWGMDFKRGGLVQMKECNCGH